MPNVPVYNPNRINESAMPNARVRADAPIEAFGGGQAANNVTKAVQGLAGLAGDVAIEQKTIADKTAIEEAKSRAISNYTKLTHGDPDGDEVGFTNKKGKQAFSVSEEYKPKFDEISSTIENELASSSQKAAFRTWVMDRKNVFDEQIAKHTSVEGERYHEESTKAGLAVSQDEAIKNYFDPNIVVRSLERQKSLIQEYGAAKGMAPEQIQNLTLDNVSKTHSAIVGRMLENGQEKIANQYLLNNKDQFNGDDYARIEKAVADGVLRGDSQRASDAIVSKSKSLTSAMEEVKKIDDPKLRDETMKRVRDDFQAQKQADEFRKDQIYQSAFDKIRNAGGKLDAVPPQMMTAMDAHQVQNLENYASNLKSGKKTVTDSQVWYDLQNRATSDATKNGFAQENLLNYINDLSQSDFQALTKLQGEIRNGDDTLSQGIRSKQDIVNETLTAAGFDTTPKAGSKVSKDVADFNRKVDEQIVVLQEQTGKKATHADVQKITDELIRKGVTERGWFFDSEKRAFQLKPTEKFIKARSVSDIDEANKTDIEAYLVKMNTKVTNENILKVYNRGKK